MTTEVYDWTLEPDYNPKSTIVFEENRLIGLVLARLPESSLSLWWQGGQVFIGRPLMPTNKGGHITRVSNYRYDYASSKKDFKALAQRFVDDDKQSELGG